MRRVTSYFPRLSRTSETLGSAGSGLIHLSISSRPSFRHRIVNSRTKRQCTTVITAHGAPLDGAQSIEIHTSITRPRLGLGLTLACGTISNPCDSSSQAPFPATAPFNLVFCCRDISINQPIPNSPRAVVCQHATDRSANPTQRDDQRDEGTVSGLSACVQGQPSSSRLLTKVT